MTCHVLFVDDETENQLLYDLIFKEEVLKSRLALVFAQSGEEALQIMQQKQDCKVDIVFSDIHMPIMNGIELLKNVRKNFPEIPFYVLSGLREGPQEDLALKNGANGFIEKPMNIFDFKKVVLDILHVRGMAVRIP